MNEMDDHAENLKRIRIRFYYGVGRIHWLQNRPVRRDQQSFYRKLAVNLREDDVTVFRFSVSDQR